MSAVSNRILVTGAAGFIGSHVVDRLLADGHDVWGLDNFDNLYSRCVKESNLEHALTHPEFRLCEGDLRDEVYLSGLFHAGQFDAVVHLAARAGARPSVQVPDEYYDCNVMGTLRLLEAMRRFSVRALLFASSSSVYGSNSRPGPFSENERADRPLSPNAASKRAGELLCHTYWHLHGLSCDCLRLSTVYGPRQRPDLAIHKFAMAICAGQPVTVYGDGSAARDFTYVDDTVDAVQASLDQVMRADRSPAYRVFNIGAARTVTVNELVHKLADAMDAVPTLEHLPPQPGDVSRTWADISRAGELLGYSPRVSIEEGLQRFVAWFWSVQERSLAPPVHSVVSPSAS